jgi:hypothetical protein
VRTPAEDGVSSGVARGESIEEIRPWREVGWIFRDGDAYAIERQGERLRSRPARISHTREEKA